MLSWLLDRANIVYFLLGVTALVFLAMAWSSRRAKFWGYAAAAIGLIVAFWLLTRFVVTDRGQVIANLDAMAKAVGEQKTDALFQHVSKDFRHGNQSREEIAKRVAAVVAASKINHVHLWDKNVTVTGETADAIFNFRADGKDGGTYAASAKAKFIREAGAWKLTEIQILKLGTTERQFIPGVD